MATIKLYGFAKAENAPSPSGYCQKLETLLRATSFASYTQHATLPFRAPKGKLPYIVLVPPANTPADTPADTEPNTPDHAETLADSHFIARRLVRGGIVRDLDGALTAAQRADSSAWIAWTEERVYPATVCARFRRGANFAALRRRLDVPGGAVARWVLAWVLRRRVQAGLSAQGVWRHTDAEVDAFLEEYLDALGARLEGAAREGEAEAEGKEEGEGVFFHGGKEPTMVDCVLAAFLMNALEAGDVNREYCDEILKRKTVRKYVEALTRRWFPEYEGLLKRLAEERAE